MLAQFNPRPAAFFAANDRRVLMHEIDSPELQELWPDLSPGRRGSTRGSLLLEATVFEAIVGAKPAQATGAVRRAGVSCWT